MPVRRGSLREGGESADGGIILPQIADTPDDTIVVDLTKDEESLNWTKYHPEDSDERFSEWSDEKARRNIDKIRQQLREMRRESGE